MVAGINYKLLYSVDCPDGTSTMMQAELYVPLPAYNEPTEVRATFPCTHLRPAPPPPNHHPHAQPHRPPPPHHHPPPTHTQTLILTPKPTPSYRTPTTHYRRR